MSGLTNYENDCMIDEDQLDKEWMKQPNLYRKYSTMLAETDADRRDQKEKIDYTKAELDIYFRDKFFEKGIKFTEKVIDSNITMHGSYQLELKALGVLERKYSTLSSAVKALDHKKKALENLVQLWLASYFSSPKELKKADNSKSMDDILIEKNKDIQRKKLKEGRA